MRFETWVTLTVTFLAISTILNSIVAILQAFEDMHKQSHQVHHAIYKQREHTNYYLPLNELSISPPSFYLNYQKTLSSL